MVASGVLVWVQEHESALTELVLTAKHNYKISTSFIKNNERYNRVNIAKWISIRRTPSWHWLAKIRVRDCYISLFLHVVSSIHCQYNYKMYSMSSSPAQSEHMFLVEDLTDDVIITEITWLLWLMSTINFCWNKLQYGAKWMKLSPRHFHRLKLNMPQLFMFIYCAFINFVHFYVLYNV
jgi:hypothetical protein